MGHNIRKEYVPTRGIEEIFFSLLCVHVSVQILQKMQLVIVEIQPEPLNMDYKYHSTGAHHKNLETFLHKIYVL